MEVPMRSAPRRYVTVARVAVIAGILLLVVSCPLVGVAVQRRMIGAPTMHESLGPLRLHAVTTLDPLCPMNFCGMDRIDETLEQYYVVWVEVVRINNGNVKVDAYRLVEMELKP
jgi:hypothetical protein